MTTSCPASSSARACCCHSSGSSTAATAAQRRGRSSLFTATARGDGDGDHRHAGGGADPGVRIAQRRPRCVKDHLRHRHAAVPVQLEHRAVDGDPGAGDHAQQQARGDMAGEPQAVDVELQHLLRPHQQQGGDDRRADRPQEHLRPRQARHHQQPADRRQGPQDVDRQHAHQAQRRQVQLWRAQQHAKHIGAMRQQEHAHRQQHQQPDRDGDGQRDQRRHDQRRQQLRQHGGG
ncbi:conserved hypothetical protein, partial [Ricinus communis]